MQGLLVYCIDENNIVIGVIPGCIYRMYIYIYILIYIVVCFFDFNLQKIAKNEVKPRFSPL